jgi:hypothetical protein
MLPATGHGGGGRGAMGIDRGGRGSPVTANAERGLHRSKTSLPQNDVAAKDFRTCNTGSTQEWSALSIPLSLENGQ